MQEYIRETTSYYLADDVRDKYIPKLRRAKDIIKKLKLNTNQWIISRVNNFDRDYNGSSARYDKIFVLKAVIDQQFNTLDTTDEDNNDTKTVKKLRISSFNLADLNPNKDASCIKPLLTEINILKNMLENISKTEAERLRGELNEERHKNLELTNEINDLDKQCIRGQNYFQSYVKKRHGVQQATEEFEKYEKFVFRT